MSAFFLSTHIVLLLFREKIAPGAFQESIENDDVRALFNHDPNQILGRNLSGTLEIEETDDGLFDRIELPDSPAGETVSEAIKRADVTGQSFGFMVQEESWERNDDGMDTRTIEKAKLFDVGPVTYPAYEDTDITTAQRRYKQWRSEKNDGREEDEPDYTQENEDINRRIKIHKHKSELNG